MSGWLLILFTIAVWLFGYLYGVWWGYRKGSENTRVIVDAEWQAIL